VKAGLLREFVSKEDFARMQGTTGCDSSNALPVPLVAPRPLDEAISSAGGVTFEAALDENLMLKKSALAFSARVRCSIGKRRRAAIC
jgi:predicted flavoprotein YhiN